jgi:hypothetical protein
MGSGNVAMNNDLGGIIGEQRDGPWGMRQTELWIRRPVSFGACEQYSDRQPEDEHPDDWCMRSKPFEKHR